MDQLTRQRFLSALLLTLFVLSAGRLIAFAWTFGQESLQMDFAAFYTAGEARMAGLSPYDNYLDRTPAVWDGFALLKHSRFLYPPFAARLFQPFALMPYAWAKMLWTAIGLGCLVVACVLVLRWVLPSIGRTGVLFAGLFVCLFHPTLTLLERGQVDSVTWLLLVLCAILGGQHKQKQAIGGALLALATLLKLHCIYFLPFLVLRKRWFGLLGFAGTGAVLLVLSLGIDGIGLHRDYVFEHLPRISTYGEGGNPDQLMPRSALEPHLANLRAGYATKDGVRYRQAAFGFVAGATLVDVLNPAGPNASEPSNSMWLSLVLFVLCFAPLVVWRFTRKAAFDRFGPFEDWVLWQLAMVIVLLCSPTTWVMNTVWLLSAGAILMHVYALPEAPVVPLYMGCLGLLVAGMPDHHTFVLLWPAVGEWMDYKYVFAEGLLLGALILLLKRQVEYLDHKPGGKGSRTR